MNKIPLYSLNQQFYLYFDMEDRRFYRALNHSIDDIKKEQAIRSSSVRFRKLLPIFIPIVLLFGTYKTSGFEQWSHHVINGILYYARKFKRKIRAYYQTRDYFLVEFSSEELQSVLCSINTHCKKVFLFRVSFLLGTTVLAVLFLLSSLIALLFLYMLMFWATNYLFVVTSMESYRVMKEFIE